METSEETPARLRELPSRLIGIASIQAGRIVSEHLADSHRYHYSLLASLEEFGPHSQSLLSDRTKIYRSDLVATLNELAEKRLVDRTPDPEDKRKNIVSITAAGRRHLERMDGRIAAAQEEILAPLDEAERAELVRLLSKLTGQ
ncbi:MarR family winged helix-turn-helix transcriptional regulator [Salininema proteolyticum]|uniref:MarR family winged helix-turn-helix transcriptional regulator n=1 Tax=Salininema proteolyticum TaxID=1607685 RepID=A0ABV8TTD1_9ACTN